MMIAKKYGTTAYKLIVRRIFSRLNSERVESCNMTEFGNFLQIWIRAAP